MLVRRRNIVRDRQPILGPSAPRGHVRGERFDVLPGGEFLNEVETRVLAAVLELAIELPPATLDALSTELESSGGSPSWTRLRALLATQAAKERLDKLANLLAGIPKLDGRTLAFAIRACAYGLTTLATDRQVDIAWTGPSTEAVPLRRV